MRRRFRSLLIFSIVVGATLFLFAVLSLTNLFLSVYQKLEAMPDWLFYAYMGVILLFVLATFWGVWQLLRPIKQVEREATNLSEIEHQASEIQGEGLDDALFNRTLGQLKDEGQTITVAFFGEVSMGKSALVKALAPEAEIFVDVRAGSTQDFIETRFMSSSGVSLSLLDTPGRNEASGQLNESTLNAAQIAHLVVYVCDGDLARTQVDDVKALQALNKPLIVALNKKDRYDTHEVLQLTQTIREKTFNMPVVAVSADADMVDVSALIQAMGNVVTKENMSDLEAKRQKAGLILMQQQLRVLQQQYREIQSAKIIKNHTQKAIIGAMASIAPGADLVIQGYFATQMSRKLCELYNVPFKQVDVDEMLGFVQSRVGQVTPIALAIGGNALKTFPGLGTLGGGAMHAVAYGLIFNALGQSLVQSLEQHGKIQPATAAENFSNLIKAEEESHLSMITKVVIEGFKNERK